MQTTTGTPDITYKVTSLGGNQYQVIATTSDELDDTIIFDTTSYTFNFDGFTPLTDEQYKILDTSGVKVPARYICPSMLSNYTIDLEGEMAAQLMAFYAFVEANPYSNMIASSGNIVMKGNYKRKKYIPPPKITTNDIAPYNIGDIVTAYGGVDNNLNLKRYSIVMEDGRIALQCMKTLTNTRISREDIEHLSFA